MKLKNAIFKNPYVIGLVATVLVYLFFVKPMFAKKDSNLLIKRIRDKKVNENLLTMSDIEAEDYANNMFAAMDGIGYAGASKVFWNDIMTRVQTKDDALLISKYFGVRNGQTLIQWLQSEWNLRFFGFYDLLILKFQL